MAAIVRLETLEWGVGAAIITMRALEIQPEGIEGHGGRDRLGHPVRRYNLATQRQPADDDSKSLRGYWLTTCVQLPTVCPRTYAIPPEDSTKLHDAALY